MRNITPILTFPYEWGRDKQQNMVATCSERLK